MKIIFLDIDGVLNRMGTVERFRGYIGIDAGLVPILNKVIEETDAKIVVSSTWRNWPGIPEAEKRQFITDTLRDHGIKGEVIGITPKLFIDTSDRWREISLWLSIHPEVLDYVIVDDTWHMGELNEKFVRTNHGLGITEANAERMIEILGQKVEA